MKAILPILTLVCCMASLKAVELPDLERGLAKPVKEEVRFLEMLTTLGLIKNQDWDEAEKIIKRSSADLGATSISIKVPPSATVKSIVLVGKDAPKENFFDIRVVAVTIDDSNDKLWNFRFSAEAGCYLLDSR